MENQGGYWKKCIRIVHRLTVLCLIGLISCSDHDGWIKLPGDEKAGKLEGVWQSEGYGYVLDIRKGMATTFDVTTETCLKKTFFFDEGSADVDGWDVDINADGTRMVYHAKGSVTTFHFVKIPALPSVCQEHLVVPTKDAKANFDLLWQTFQDHYAFFDRRNVDWAAIKAKYRPQATEANLETVFQQMLAHFEEDHVSLVSHGDDFVNRYDAGVSRTFRRFYPEFPNPENQKAFKTYLLGLLPAYVENIVGGYLGGQVSSALDDQLLWGRLDAKTGYVFIRSMSGYTMEDLQAALDKMMDELASCDRIVLDLRFNVGGSDAVSLEIAGRFVSERKVAWQLAARNGAQLTAWQQVMMKPTGKVQFTKPIVVLTSIMTSSAAETFTLAIRERGNVKLAGETTNGIFSTTLTKELPNGWTLSLSNEVIRDAKGTVYEAIGIAPDVPVNFPSKEDRENGIDPALENYTDLF